jgi:hypothetical protein
MQPYYRTLTTTLHSSQPKTIMEVEDQENHTDSSRGSRQSGSPTQKNGEGSEEPFLMNARSLEKPSNKLMKVGRKPSCNASDKFKMSCPTTREVSTHERSGHD